MRNANTKLANKLWAKLISYNNYHGAFIAISIVGAANHCSYSAAVLATYASVFFAKRLMTFSCQSTQSQRT